MDRISGIPVRPCQIIDGIKRVRICGHCFGILSNSSRIITCHVSSAGFIVSFIKHIVLKQGIQAGVKIFSFTGHGFSIHLCQLGCCRRLISRQISACRFQKLIIRLHLFIRVILCLVCRIHLTLVSLDLFLQSLYLCHLLRHFRICIRHLFIRGRIDTLTRSRNC